MFNRVGEGGFRSKGNAGWFGTGAVRLRFYLAPVMS